MKKSISKPILIFLLSVLLLATLAAFASAEGDVTIVDSGTCGSNLTWTFDSAGTLTISGNGSMKSYSPTKDNGTTRTDAPWGVYYKTIQTVVLDEGVTNIGSFAFFRCTSLTSVTIPDSVTSIGVDAFYKCTSLTSVTIPDSVTSIGNYAFQNCTALTSVMIPNSVTSIGTYAFGGCTSLTSVTIPDSVTSIGYGAFDHCTSLTSVTIPDSVTSIGIYAFEDCTSLTSVTIPDSVTSIGDFAFRDCTALTSVTIPDSVTSIGGAAFAGCTSLTNVTIGNSVTSIGYETFFGCSSLTGFSVDEINPYYASDANGCLYNKNKTALIQYPIGNKRTSFSIPNHVTRIDYHAFYRCTSLTSVMIPDSVWFIGAYAFNNCSSLKDVYYTGTEEQWNRITIEEYNNPLLNATINYYYDFAADGKVKIEFRYADTEALIDTSDEYDVDARDSLNFKDQYGRHRHESGANGILYLGDYYFPLTYVNARWQSSFGGPAYQYEDETTIEASAGDVVRLYLSETREGRVSVQPAATYTPTSDAEVADRNDAFVKAHLTSYGQSVLPMIFKNSFSNLAEISDTKLTLAKIKKYTDIAADFVTLDLGDAIGKVTANYYEMYLSSLILDFTQNKLGKEIAKKVDKVFGGYKDVYGFFKDAFKSTAEWEKSVTKDVELDFQKFFKLDDYCDNIPDATVKVFAKLLPNHMTETKSFFLRLLSQLPESADAINQMCEKITTATDILKAFREVYNAYVVATAFHEVTDDFYKVMLDAADELDNVEEAAPDAGRQLRIAIQDAKLNSNTVGDVICTILKEFEGQAAKIAWDKLGKPLLTPIMCTKVASLLKIKASTVAVYTALIGGGNKVINLFTGADDYSEKYQLIAKITPVEHALRLAVKNQFQRLINDYPQLNSDLNMENTTRYETAVQLLKHTNAYLFQLDYDICAISKGRILSDGAALQKEMDKAAEYKASWNNLSCHDESAFSDFKFVTTKCPVDVYVYMPNDFLVTSIVNEQIEESDPEFTALVAAGEKTIIYPAAYDCTVKIVARESGTMDYGVMELNDVETTREVETYDIPLTAGQVFTGVIPQEKTESKTEYALTTNDETISVDYDSMESCTGTHAFGDWSESEISRTRVCTVCGFTESEVLHKTHDEPEVAYSVKPTCTEGGHTILVCPGCGEQLADGNDCPPLGHEPDEASRVTVDATCGKAGGASYTCLDCGEIITETIPATGEHMPGNAVKENVRTESCTVNGSYDEVIYCAACGEELSRKTSTIPATGNHLDDNNDGKCDTCNQKMTGGKHCKYCGKIHGGAFGWLTKFFHSILAIFKR